jgi:hypothetical protein
MSGNWPKDRPPATVRALERWISDRVRETGESADSLRRGLSAMVVAGVLGRCTDRSGVPLILVKGGTHMLLRFGASARPSKDFDVAVAENANHLDLQLLAGEVDGIGVRSVRVACVHVFERRAAHPWPPQVHIFPGWDEAYRALAERVGFPVTDVHDAAANVSALIAHIDRPRKSDEQH